MSIINDNLRAGNSRERILENYPSLKSEDIDAALEFANSLARNRKRRMQRIAFWSAVFVLSLIPLVFVVWPKRHSWADFYWFDIDRIHRYVVVCTVIMLPAMLVRIAIQTARPMSEWATATKNVLTFVRRPTFVRSQISVVPHAVWIGIHWAFDVGLGEMNWSRVLILISMYFVYAIFAYSVARFFGSTCKQYYYSSILSVAILLITFLIPLAVATIVFYIQTVRPTKASNDWVPFVTTFSPLAAIYWIAEEGLRHINAPGGEEKKAAIGIVASSVIYIGIALLLRKTALNKTHSKMKP